MGDYGMDAEESEQETSGILIDANPAFCAMVGWSMDELQKAAVPRTEAERQAIRDRDSRNAELNRWREELILEQDPHVRARLAGQIRRIETKIWASGFDVITPSRTAVLRA